MRFCVTMINNRIPQQEILDGEERMVALAVAALLNQNSGWEISKVEEYSRKTVDRNSLSFRLFSEAAVLYAKDTTQSLFLHLRSLS